MKKFYQKSSVTELVLIIFLFAFSFCILFFSTSSSPRYAINPWCDSNAFFTVGKAMVNNMVPYKDIFEQKGPLLYLIHSIAYLISNTSFTGVYIMESLAFGITSTAIFKISQNYISKTLSVIVSVLSVTVMVTSPCFYYGDSAEEFCLPTLLIGLYYFLTYFKDSQKNLKPTVFLLCGFLAGCTALIKFTILGFWFGWMAAIAIHVLVLKKEVKNAFRFSFIFLAGMVLAFLPWIIYFIYNNALKDFIDVYFICNATAYADYSTSQNGIKILISELFYRYYRNLIRAVALAACSAFGAVSTVFISAFSDKKIYSRFAVPIVFFSTLFFTYIGGVSPPYYFFVFSVFVCLIFIAFFVASEKLFKRINKYSLISILSVFLVSVLSVFLSVNYSVSSRTVAKEKEDTYQYVFSQYIKENASTPNPKVFTYNGIDSGIYVFNNLLPELKYFELQNIPYENYPDNLDEHIRYINEHIADYVVSYEITPDDKSKLTQDYRLVKEMPRPVFSSEINDVLYMKVYLYELKDAGN